MQKVLIVAVVVLVCLPVLLSAAKGGARRAKGRRGGEGEDEAANQRRDCGEWVEGPCVPKNNAACGAGMRNKTRTGDNCPVKEKTGKCHLPCSGPPAQGGAAARPAGGRAKAKAAKCKYIKGEWSPCDATTNTKTRTLTLKTRRNSAPSTDCEQTKSESRKCAAARKNRRGPGN